MTDLIVEEGKESTYVLDDIIAGMLILTGLSSFTGKPLDIHRFIYDERRKYTILNSFSFSQDDIHPFSRVLERVLSRLELSRIIGMENPDFDRFIIKPAGIDIIKNDILPLFAKDEIEQLTGIAEDFKNNCC
jgi:hypothetical protein